MRELFQSSLKSDIQELKDILAGADIESDVRENRDGDFCLWVLDDSEIDSSRKLLLEWQGFRDSPKWKTLKSKGKSNISKAQKENLDWERSTKKQQEKFKQGTKEIVLGGVTLFVMVACGLVALMTKLGEDSQMVSFFTIADYLNVDEGVDWSQWQDVKRGEVWRLLSPCFIHFGLIHIVFNLLWLKDLGTKVEVIENSIKLVFVIVFVGVVSNVGQAFWSPLNPKFGGMSGVVYGLLGYQWVQGKLNIRRSYSLNQQTVVWMMGWFVLCFTGLVGPVANGAHALGLLSGCLLGAVSRNNKSTS